VTQQLKDYPPDDLTLKVRNWLAGEVYPGLLGEAFDARAAAVWIDGSQGFVSLWVSGFGNHLPPLERLAFCQHELFRRIEAVKRQQDAANAPPVAPVTVPVGDFRPLVGIVRPIDGGRKGVQDDTGPRLIAVLHAGDLLAEAFNHGWSKVADALEYAKSRRFHALRTWTNLPAPEWWGVPPRPGNFSDANPEHEACIRQFARALVARGLRWQVSQGDMLWLHHDEGRACDYMRRLGRWLQEEGGAERLVLSVDAGNEAWNFTRETDPARLGRILQAFIDVCPVPLRSMTSVPDEGVLNQFSASPVTVTDYHSSRLPFRHAIERMFTAGYWDGKDHALIENSEMPGCGPFVSATAHPEEWLEPEVMGAAAVVTLMTRQIPTAMSSPGVISGSEPFENYDALLSLFPKIADLLPADIGSWKLFHGGEGRASSPDRVLAVSGDNVRCDHAKADDGRVAVLVYADEPCHLELLAIHGFDGDIINPGTLERFPLNFAAGSRVSLDLRRARLLLGKVQ
jgi:hypothetical protein